MAGEFLGGFFEIVRIQQSARQFNPADLINIQDTIGRRFFVNDSEIQLCRSSLVNPLVRPEQVVIDLIFRKIKDRFLLAERENVI